MVTPPNLVRASGIECLVAPKYDLAVGDKHGERWQLDYRIQDESDRHVIALEHPKQTGEWWLHIFPCWENHEAESLIYGRGIEVGPGMPDRVFRQLEREGRAVRV